MCDVRQGPTAEQGRELVDDQQTPAAPQRSHDSEADAQRLVRLGDYRRALHQLMQCHGDSIRSFCRTILRDTDSAEEVCQQVFIEAFHDLPNFAGRSSLRTWLFSIARHRSLDAMKRDHRWGRFKTDEVPDPPDPQPSAADSIDTTKLHAELAACIATLAAPVQVTIILRYGGDLTYEEIAKRCGGTPATHHARVVRALPILRRQLEARIASEAAKRQPA